MQKKPWTLCTECGKFRITSEDVRLCGFCRRRLARHGMIATTEEESSRRARREALAEERFKLVVTGIKAGNSMSAIARELGVSSETLRKVLAKFGTSVREIRPPKPPPPTAEDKLQRRFERIRRRFLSNVEINKTCGCWEWTGEMAATNRRSANWKLPCMTAHDPIRTGKSRRTYAYRIAYQLFVGEIPERMAIMRKCHNARCCNPEHLTMLTPRKLGQATRWAEAKRGLTPRESWKRAGKDRTASTRLSPPEPVSDEIYCLRGHPLFGKNLRIIEGGLLLCRTCNEAYSRS